MLDVVKLLDGLKDKTAFAGTIGQAVEEFKRLQESLEATQKALVVARDALEDSIDCMNDIRDCIKARTVIEAINKHIEPNSK